MFMGDKENQRRMFEGKRICPKCGKEFELKGNENPKGYKCPICKKTFFLEYD